ncbi:MAG TPA: hypothetical protein ENK87_03175 [Nitratifractor sp.]|nr:hypothetical protein [Nitratifractor sp.]HHH20908.1 hypothetical protein [Nitratifractor sp.]
MIHSGAKMIYVDWKEKQQLKYKLIVALHNRAGTLLELLKELEKFDLNITKIEFGIENSNEAEYCTLEVETSLDIQNRIKDIIANKFRLIDFISLKDAYKH